MKKFNLFKQGLRVANYQTNARNQEKFLKTIREEWDNRPPTHESFLIVREGNISEGDCEEFASDYGSEYSNSQNPLTSQSGDNALLHFNTIAKH